MALNSDFIKAVSEGRMWAVYQRLADIMPIDPSLREQDEMLKYAEQNLAELYQQHDGEVLITNIADWTDQYYKEQKRRLEKNFSRERLDFLRDMTKHRFADTIKYRAEQERERQEKASAEKVIEAKRIAGAAAVAGVVAAGIGVIVGSTAVAVVGAVVAVGGIAVAVADSTRK